MDDQDDTTATDPAAPDRPASLQTPPSAPSTGWTTGGAIVLASETVAGLARADTLPGRDRPRRPKQRSMPVGGWP